MIKPAMSKTPGIIWPAFESQFKCQESYKNFLQNREYRITAFGTEIRGEEKKEVWWITPIDDEEQETFTIIKTTINALFDRRILINTPTEPCTEY